MQFKAKIFIDGKIKVITGLAIGGSDSDAIIGGIDNGVIKDASGKPFIPGSSLKGKIRSLLEISETKIKNICDCGNCEICTIFGAAADKKEEGVGPTRLFVRDAYLSDDTINKMVHNINPFEELELTYTEGKVENTIDRKTSRANPRHLERVPAGAEFNFQITYNILEDKDLGRFKKVIVGLRMLEDDYLGGNGSRGYGRIKFTNVDIGIKTIKNYETDNKRSTLFKDEFENVKYDDLREKIIEEVGKISDESN